MPDSRHVTSFTWKRTAPARRSVIQSKRARIADVLAAGRPPGEPLLVGSVKTNIGHLEPASGVAGLIKAVLVLEQRMVPPSLHFEKPNPRLPLDRIRVPTTLTPLPVPPAGRTPLVGGEFVRVRWCECPRAAGAGSGCRRDERAAATRRTDEPCVFPVFRAQRRRAGGLRRRFAQSHREKRRRRCRCASLCAAAALGKSHHPLRRALVADSLADLREQLLAVRSRPRARGERSSEDRLRLQRPGSAVVGDGASALSARKNRPRMSGNAATPSAASWADRTCSTNCSRRTKLPRGSTTPTSRSRRSSRCRRPGGAVARVGHRGRCGHRSQRRRSGGGVGGGHFRSRRHLPRHPRPQPLAGDDARPGPDARRARSPRTTRNPGSKNSPGRIASPPSTRPVRSRFPATPRRWTEIAVALEQGEDFLPLPADGIRVSQRANGPDWKPGSRRDLAGIAGVGDENADDFHRHRRAGARRRNWTPPTGGATFASRCALPTASHACSATAAPRSSRSGRIPSWPRRCAEIALAEKSSVLTVASLRRGEPERGTTLQALASLYQRGAAVRWESLYSRPARALRLPGISLAAPAPLARSPRCRTRV